MSPSLSPLEATFLDGEDSAEDNPERFSEINHKHFTWAMVFDPLPSGGAPSLEKIRSRVAEGLELLPRFRERLSTNRVGRLARPRWIPDTTFDIARHVDQETLPAPGGEQELLAWLADLEVRRLDRRIPMWHLTLLTGLADGGWALVIKMHHCMIDGVGGAVAAAALLIDGGVQTTPETSAHNGAGRSSAKRPGTLRAALSGARTLGRMLYRQPAPPTGTSLMVELGPNRHLAFLDMPLIGLKAIRSGLGGTINDIAMTAIIGGLRAMFKHRGETPLPDHLRILVPVNMRTPSEAHSVTMNVSFLNMAVPLAEENLRSRYLETVRTTETMKQSRRVAGDQTLANLANLIPPGLQRALSRHVAFLGHYDVMITNIPGPQGHLSLMDAPLRRVLPVVPPSTDHVLSATVCSYSGTVTLGFNADRDAVPDLDVVRSGTQRTLEELGHIAERRGSR